MPHPDTVKLLGAPYRRPAVKKGDRAFCFNRDSIVIITGYSSGRLRWPLGRMMGQSGRGLVVEKELARAVRTESAEAIKYWWGVGVHAVWNWRRALGVSGFGTAGSKRLQATALRVAVEASQRKRYDPDEFAARCRAAYAKRLQKCQAPDYRGPWWTPQQIALLGTMSDVKVARLIGRPPDGVRQKRQKLKIPEFRGKSNGPPRRQHRIR